MQKAMNRDIRINTFPSFDYAENEEPIRRRCMSFGEAASAFSWPPSSPTDTADFFKIFYNGFTNDTMIWFIYEGADDFELPAFRFSKVYTDSAEVFQRIVSPGILPVDFRQGRTPQTVIWIL